MKLEQKLSILKGFQGFMKTANKCVRRKDKEGFLTLKFGTPERWDELTRSGRHGGMGFASYTLTNNNANIKRVEQRILQLKVQEAKTAVDIVVNGVRIFENREANRLLLFFDGRPSVEIIQKLKQHGFRWCHSEVAWQRHISNNAIYWGRIIADSVTV